MMKRTSAALAVMGSAMAAVVWMAGAATAQTDEAEIQALRDQVRALQARLEALESRQEVMESRGEGTEEQVEKVADPAIQTEQPVRLTLAGRVNQAVLFADQGDQSQAFVVDNDNSGSRLEVLAEADLGDWTSGVEVVVSAEVNSTDEINFDSVGGNADENADLGDFRQAHWFVEHPQYGTLSIGQGDTAAEDMSHVDLSGTDCCIAASDVDDTAGGLQFAAADGTDLVEGDDDEIDDFFDALDGSRASRVLYETPQVWGFGLRGSLANADDGGNLQPAVAATYAATFRGFDVEGAVAWRHDDAEDEVDSGQVINGSVSILSPVGISLTLAGGWKNSDDDSFDDPNAYYAKLGYREEFFDFGDTRFSVDYFVGHNNVTFASPAGGLPEATSIGGGIVQAVDPLAAEFYVGVRTYKVEDLYLDGEQIGDPDSLLTVISGARVRF